MVPAGKIRGLNYNARSGIIWAGYTSGHGRRCAQTSAVNYFENLANYPVDDGADSLLRPRWSRNSPHHFALKVDRRHTEVGSSKVNGHDERAFALNCLWS